MREIMLVLEVLDLEEGDSERDNASVRGVSVRRR